MVRTARLRRAGGAAAPGLWAFTLIELLLVVLILGIAAAAVLPRLTGMMEGGSAAVAARAIAQAGRYARTMALLNQVTMELVLNLDQPELRVEVAERSGGSTRGSETATAFGRAVSRDERLTDQRGLGLRDAAEPSDGAGGPRRETDALAESLAFARKLDGVRITFGGYLDRPDLPGADAGEEGVVRIRYRSNGTCRPYRVVIQGERTEQRFELAVDAVGTPELLRPGETTRRGRR